MVVVGFESRKASGAAPRTEAVPYKPRLALCLLTIREYPILLRIIAYKSFRLLKMSSVPS